MQTQKAPQPQIYVACLASYNNGILYGKWIDADNADIMQDEINEMLKNSPEADAEEWEIHDHEYLGNNVSSDLEEIANTAAFIKEHGELGLALIEHTCNDLEYAERLMEDYQGEYDNEEAFGWHIYEECYEYQIPENLRFYFDIEKFTRDLFLDGYMSIEVNGICHVFNER